MAERRRYKRIHYRREINYSDGECLYQGAVGDISDGGMFIHTSADLRPGTKIALYVGLPRHDCAVDSVIVRQGRAGIGVAFTERHSLDRIMVKENNEMWG